MLLTTFQIFPISAQTPFFRDSVVIIGELFDIFSETLKLEVHKGKKSGGTRFLGKIPILPKFGKHDQKVDLFDYISNSRHYFWLKMS